MKDNFYIGQDWEWNEKAATNMTVSSDLQSSFVGSYGNHNIATVTEYYYVLHQYTYTNSEHNHIVHVCIV